MSGRGVIGGFLAAGLVLLIVAVPAQPSAERGAAAQLYKFKFVGPVHMDWQWPPNPFNDGKRETDKHDVFSGKGCGTKPAKARWKIKQQTGDLPASSLIIDFVNLPDQENPALITDANYSGEPPARMKIFLHFGKGKQPKVTLSGEPTGDIIGPNIDPATAKITARKTDACPI